MIKYTVAFFAFTFFVLNSFTTAVTPTTIEGQVIDKKNKEPLIGVSVVWMGTTQGTATDFEGKFSLPVAELPGKLQISYTGYQTVTKEIKKYDKPLTIELESAATLDEVVVVGYGKKRRPKSRQNRKSMFRSASPMINSTVPMGAAPTTHDNRQNTEDYGIIKENRFVETTQTPLSTFSIDVDAASYANMRRFINEGQQPPKDAIRIEEMINYFDYEYAEPVDRKPFTVATEVSDCPWQPKHKLLHVGLKGKSMDTKKLPPSNLVFLLDVSGSMSSHNKLPLLKSSFKLLTDQLRPEDKVSIVVYAGASGVVLPPTSGSNKQKIKAALDQLNAGGSTAGGAGIQLAYKLAKENFVQQGNNRVILATDGDFNVGLSSDAELVRLIEKERESGVFLTVMGFGTGNYKDNKMQQLANKGNGNHAYIDNINEAKKVLVNEFGGTLFTIAKDVKIQIEFNPSQVQGYRLIGYENRLLNKEDFNDDKKDAGELGAGHTVTALYEIIPAGIESSFLSQVDDLKYQTTNTSQAATTTDELLTIKLRYKQPDGNKSILMEEVIKDTGLQLQNSSDNFRFAAAVAEFGLLLRASEFKGEATYDHASKLAEAAKGKDTNGYRAELVTLMGKMKDLVEPETAKK